MTFGRCRLTGGFVLLWALLFFFDEGGWLPLVAAAAVVHELGHWLAMRLFGKRVHRITFDMSGMTMEMSALPPVSHGAEILITLAGPLAGFLCAFCAAWCNAPVLAGVNAALSLVNLLPAATLDGGRALSLTAQALFGERAARAVAVTGTALSLAALGLFGVWVMSSTGGKNITPLLLAAPAAIFLLNGTKRRAVPI